MWRPRGWRPARGAGPGRGRAEAAEQALGRLAPLPAEAAAGSAESAESPEAAEARLDAARQAEQRTQQGLAQAQAALAAAQSRLATARQEQQSAQAALDDPARQAREAQAQQQLLAVQGEEAALAARIAQAQAALAEARPDIVAQDIARLQASVGQRLAQHQQRASDLQVRAATLQQAGALGLEEQRDTLAGEQARVARRVAELQRRARALDWLCRTLDAKRQATLARLQAPLQQRLQHYLPLLLPGARVEITEALAPGQLLRPGPQGQPEAGAVDELSFGAREQLGLIARFAYADLLREAGRPTLLILDDALVHSDAGRLAQMKRVLFDAAQRHQVLLFTCHPEDWQDMGVPLRPWHPEAPRPATQLAGRAAAPSGRGAPICACSRTTSPMISSAGDTTWAASTRSASVASVPVRTCCVGSEAEATRAAGQSAPRQLAASAWQMARSRVSPM
jgi:chemotaxis protein histidine kinase CheA